MKKIYDEYFSIPGNGKIREKVMLMRAAVSVIVIVLCLAGMAMTAYAYFSHSVTSAANVIRSANFMTKVSVSIMTGSENDSVEVKEVNSLTHTALLEKDKVYTITIEKAGTAQTGFCVISAEGCNVEKYHTQQLGKDVKSNVENNDTITFQLKVTDDTVVSFCSHWGTSSYYADYENKGEDGLFYIVNGEEVVMQITNEPATIGDGDDSAELESTDTNEIIHTIEYGEILSEIANSYKTTVARIVAYNEISDPNKIQAGDKLKIPPDDWEIPESTGTETDSVNEETTIPMEIPETTVTESTVAETTTASTTAEPVPDTTESAEPAPTETTASTTAETTTAATTAEPTPDTTESEPAEAPTEEPTEDTSQPAEETTAATGEVESQPAEDTNGSV